MHLTQQTAGNGIVTSQVFDPQTGRLSQISAGDAGAVQSQAYTYDLVGKLITRSDANTSLAESFTYDILNRLTSSTVSLTPAPLVATFAYNAIGNLTFKSDVGTYSYPAPGEPRPHGVSSISGGAINTTFTYDAWGVRRNPDGTPDPSGSISSQSSRGFTGHEHLEEVGLIHMNGRVYDPLLARFGTPDPTTENPFSTQGWNRYSSVGNSPVNFTDPTGYCFMGCFWKPVFKAIGQFFQKNFAAIIQVAATALLCVGPTAPICAGVIAFARPPPVTIVMAARYARVSTDRQRE